LAAVFPADANLPFDTLSYGPGIPDERTFRLLGSLGALEGRRVLELGCGSGQASVALAKLGAKVITVDPSAERLERVRAACEREHVRVEIHQGDLAEVAFVRADTIDAVVSIYALATVADLDRVFRQAHRVLGREAPLVFSVPHPAFAMLEPYGPDPLHLTRSYFDHTSEPWRTDDAEGEQHHHTISELLTSLFRANFRVDTVLEPEADGRRSEYHSPAMELVPATLVVRARKQGL
jgi:ubiquinone/menaquinone biosynthesis C-methylase UbiE